ncbi:MAG: lipoate--protein ligase family protein, partial [Planctomycetales bacterium]|nr:lipoate--protein ligase family protein [Planctomycetales bacterium]NIP69175.1 lipoate--protein ligase family protein [Planctomycetales bacterium]
TLCPGGCAGAESEREFLCFLRRAAGDVLVGGTKIAGSAQRRRRGAVLQHGSVLLQTSESSPELAALNDLAQRPIT